MDAPKEACVEQRWSGDRRLMGLHGFIDFCGAMIVDLWETMVLQSAVWSNGSSINGGSSLPEEALFVVPSGGSNGAPW